MFKSSILSLYASSHGLLEPCSIQLVSDTAYHHLLYTLLSVPGRQLLKGRGFMVCLLS